jgi:phosphinothricin acetyltransferase
VPVIRLAREADAAQMLEIYAPIVRETAISFELEPPTPPEMRARIRDFLEHGAWLVCEYDGRIAGYAYAKRFWPRAAYQWSVEVTVYVHPESHRQGIGRALYTSLFALLKLQGYQKALAIIALPNPASIALHQQFGFVSVGVFHSVGHKFGRWHDVSWWELPLGTFPGDPEPPLPVETLVETTAYQAALKKGEQLLVK